MDISGVTFDIDMSGLIPALIPKLIPALVTELSSNPTLAQDIVNAIMPQLRTQMASLARTTAGTGTTTPAPGKRP
jgi:hypothetical protein